MPTPLTRKPVRINVELSGTLHHKLRMLSVDEGTNLQIVVERLLREAMGMPPLPDQPEEGKLGGEVRYGSRGISATCMADAQR